MEKYAPYRPWIRGLSFALCLWLLAGCGSDSPTRERLAFSLMRRGFEFELREDGQRVFTATSQFSLTDHKLRLHIVPDEQVYRMRLSRD